MIATEVQSVVAPGSVCTRMVQWVPMGSGQKRWDKKVFGVLLALLVLVVIGQLAYSYFVSPKAVMHLNGERFEISIADTDRTRIKGLSGTHHLPRDEAMVFIFDRDEKWSIWMKDMNYAIDIVWLNDKKQVVDFVTNVPPDSYPNKTFAPEEKARYVVEFQSGVVEEKGIKVGQTAVFSGTSKEI